MNEYERSYQHYLRTLPRREAKRLRSAAWAKAHPTYWLNRKPIKPIRFMGSDLLAEWVADVRRQAQIACGVPPGYLWVSQPHPRSELHPERSNSHKA